MSAALTIPIMCSTKQVQLDSQHIFFCIQWFIINGLLKFSGPCKPRILTNRIVFNYTVFLSKANVLHWFINPNKYKLAFSFINDSRNRIPYLQSMPTWYTVGRKIKYTLKKGKQNVITIQRLRPLPHWTTLSLSIKNKTLTASIG